MSTSPEHLSQRCAAILAGAGKAITWVEETRPTSQRLDREAPSLIERLRKVRNLCRRLGAAASRPMSVGFFGMSQAGKSYLISSLARGPNGQLETMLDGQRLDFIDHINPPGGGKEATGLVTRFTRRPVESVAGYPVRLELLNEADVIKLLGNSFFCDFNREKVSLNTDAQHIQAILSAARARRQAKRQPGLDEDAVTDIRDYFEKHFEKSMNALPADYWPSAIELAPFLAPADRARLFSILWGEFPEFIDGYQTLRQALATLSFATAVNAPTSALVERAGGEYSQINSIMNVDAVRCRFGQDADDLVSVVPMSDGITPAEVRVARSLLAALTKEMVCVLAEPPRVELLEHVDLLDFPGYRGRMGLEKVADAAVQDKGAHPLGTLLLRGKVAYLFERYTDDQEMNGLILCNASDEQINITDLGPVLDSWVWATQGRTPQERAKRAPGLLYALTKLDRRLIASLNQTDSNLSMKWTGMMDAVLLERFGKNEWVRHWSHDRAFDNVFLVRKPGMATGIIDTVDEVEKGVLPAVAEDLARMRATFVANEVIQRHVSGPGEKWDAMLALDDGGMSGVVDHLKSVTMIATKLDRIAEQIAHIEHDLTESQLGGYYRADGADEVARKKQIVDMVLGSLQRRPTSFGEVLRQLQPQPEHLRALYTSAELVSDDTPAGGSAANASAPVDEGVVSLDLGLIGLDIGAGEDSPAPAAPSPTRSGRAARFGKAAISDWIRQLRKLPENPDALNYLGLPAEVAQALVDEVITGAMRFRLEDRLVAALHDAEVQASTTRSRLADQQVRVTCAVIDDYVDWLGFSEVPLEQRPASKVPGAKIFTPPPVLTGLPKLLPSPLNFSAIVILDWFEAFRATAIGNAGHSAGSEITPEQNERLGAIIRQISGALTGAAAD